MFRKNAFIQEERSRISCRGYFRIGSGKSTCILGSDDMKAKASELMLLGVSLSRGDHADGIQQAQVWGHRTGESERALFAQFYGGSDVSPS